MDVTTVLEGRHAGLPDPYKVALCIEGGGMRGVVSAGMVAALQDLGAARLFDHVYGSSAGALNGAYLLAGQADEGLPIYSEILPARHFVWWRRYLRGGPLLDLDDLLDVVMGELRPLDWSALTRSSPTFHALAYDIAARRSVALPDPRSRDQLFGALRATCRVPIVGGPPVEHDAHRWCDPALDEPVPCHTPLSHGATHLVVLSTRPAATIARALSRARAASARAAAARAAAARTAGLRRRVGDRLLTRWEPELAGVPLSNTSANEREASVLAELVASGRALIVAPEGAVVGRLEMDPETLRRGADQGRAAVLRSALATLGAGTRLGMAEPALAA
jgi:predicted patatin/cPLA2 family phospholipase